MKRNSTVVAEQWKQSSTSSQYLLPQDHFCSSFHLLFLRDGFKLLRIRAQDFFGFKRSNREVWQWDPLTGWEVTCQRSQRKSASDTRPALTVEVQCQKNLSSSIILLWVSKEMSVTQPKDRVELWEREPSRVTWFHAVSLIFCLASEIYFTRRWERTWNKIDLGWANIWQCSVGNNHLSWEISAPGDTDGTKNICLSPQSQGFYFQAWRASILQQQTFLFIYYFWNVVLPGVLWKTPVRSRCSHTCSGAWAEWKLQRSCRKIITMD